MNSPDIDRADRDANALLRAHLVAALVWCVVVGVLGSLIGLQLLNPGVFGDAAWMSVGRLHMANEMAVRLGLFGRNGPRPDEEAGDARNQSTSSCSECIEKSSRPLSVKSRHSGTRTGNRSVRNALR